MGCVEAASVICLGHEKFSVVMQLHQTVLAQDAVHRTLVWHLGDVLHTVCGFEVQPVHAERKQHEAARTQTHRRMCAQCPCIRTMIVCIMCVLKSSTLSMYQAYLPSHLCLVL